MYNYNISTCILNESYTTTLVIGKVVYVLKKEPSLTVRTNPPNPCETLKGT